MLLKILVADDISLLGLEKLQSIPDMEVVVRTGMSESEVMQAISNADALLVRSQTKVTERVLSAAKSLQVIGRAGVGVDNIDVLSATRRGVVVINAPDGNTIAAAEHTLAMMLGMSRLIPQAFQSIQSGAWDRKSFVGVELYGKTLAVVGMGHIGAEVAKRAKAFGMRVIGFDPFLSEERARLLGITRATLDEAVSEADFITVHTPLTKETHHLLGKAQFAAMKKGVRVINCARGGIVDEVALAEGLESGRVAGAALDVYETEPFALDHPLRHFKNVIFTPHLGASTVEAQVNVAISVAEEVANVLQGKPFQNAINLPSLSAEQKAYLQPFLTLGERLGSFLGQAVPGSLEDLEITYGGDLADQDVSFIARTVLKGLLGQRHGDEVNYVNAPFLAKAAGLEVREVKQPKSRVYTNLLTVGVTSGKTRHTVSGTLYNGSGPRIVEVDDYLIDAQPEGAMIFTRHQDRPGMIGRIGMILGEADINIASMQVGRKETGGEAVMLLTVDKPVPESAIEKVQTLSGIFAVHRIEL
ncbi:phosphoglycerate dehydrogenase [Alicyclobacillaceae bacterium I2511]|nr:phosphoglycerate dehydrogenase [Alicyclobacillaceae bacterium I2511]